MRCRHGGQQDPAPQAIATLPASQFHSTVRRKVRPTGSANPSHERVGGRKAVLALPAHLPTNLALGGLSTAEGDCVSHAVSRCLGGWASWLSTWPDHWVRGLRSRMRRNGADQCSPLLAPRLLLGLLNSVMTRRKGGQWLPSLGGSFESDPGWPSEHPLPHPPAHFFLGEILEPFRHVLANRNGKEHRMPRDDEPTQPTSFVWCPTCQVVRALEYARSELDRLELEARRYAVDERHRPNGLTRKMLQEALDRYRVHPHI